MSDPVEPIVYYLDPGTPEPVRSALLDGARWWNDAFEAIGYRDAFQVRIRPDSISPLDARYHVINWVHRSTRGWSTGGSVTDPRTGEIMKGVVTLGSLRIRQDYMIAEGLLSPYETGNESPQYLEDWAVARIRQLSAHEVGHTIGLGHNYYNSTAGRISVMDYPHPLVELDGDELDYSEVYDVGMGEWDMVAVEYGYQDFPPGTDEEAELERILDEAWDDDVLYMTNQDVRGTPQADQWALGTDMADELQRMMDVRAHAMERFGIEAIRNGRPMATIEETLVPLYMHHRFQVESTATALGGVEYTYATRGDGLNPMWRTSAADQNRALDAMMRTITPAELAVPVDVINLIPPRPPGYGATREIFPRFTGPSFDAITPAVVASSHTINSLLTPDRAARLLEQNLFDASLPSLDDVLDRVVRTAMDAPANGAYEEEIKRAVQAVVVDRIQWLAANAPMPAVRASASQALRGVHGNLVAMSGSAHATLIASNIQRFLERPAETISMPSAPNAPPGAPIGDPAMEWLTGLGIGTPALDWLTISEPWCTWEEGSF